MTAARVSLYDRLVNVLGVDYANTLMSFLPDDPPASKSDLAETRAELRNEISELRSELKGEIGDLRTELKAEVGELRADIRRLDDRIHGFYDVLHAQTRVHVAASLGSAVTVAGFVFIAAQLV